MLRWAVRASISVTTNRWRRLTQAEQVKHKNSVINSLKQAAIATHTEAANQQHYEVPSHFFDVVLGPWRKYSCCYWPENSQSLEQAETAMLDMTCQRADMQDGMRMLDLGCGWGSLSIWLALNYPSSQITALSNSHSQRRFIQSWAAEEGLTNLNVLTASVTEVDFQERYDRVLSIEMFEHMSNYRQLLSLISNWLTPAGKLFVHHFSHRQQTYKFDPDDPTNYMAHTYFAGGTMPSHDLLNHFQDDLVVEKAWQINGLHYARTLRSWLQNLDSNRRPLLDFFQTLENGRTASQWMAYWRYFFIICEETFAFNRGRDYQVSHILMAKR